jgi:hypothetical protein
MHIAEPGGGSGAFAAAGDPTTPARAGPLPAHFQAQSAKRSLVRTGTRPAESRLDVAGPRAQRRKTWH